MQKCGGGGDGCKSGSNNSGGGRNEVMKVLDVAVVV